MADDEAQQGKRTCPVCDEAVSAQATVCPSCNTDLSLFAAEEMEMVPEDAEALKSQIMADDKGHLSDLMKAADEDIISSESFECPECNGAVPADANACPHCGVEFEMDEVFECPMCKSMIDVTVNKCPSCGAEFEEDSAESEPVDISSQIVEEPVPEPEPEVPAEPVSFADRLKQVKDDPSAPAPKPVGPPKELSFAERMKAMKDGTLETSEPELAAAPAPEPVKTLTPEPATAPTPEPEPTPAPEPTLTPGPEKPAAPKPAEEQSFSERMKAIKQAAQEKPAEKPAQEPAAPAPAPASAPQVVKAAPDPETAKKESYKELPRYIGEVKKLLLLANGLKIDISASKALINQAVTAGKKRDLESAIKLVKEGKAGLERDLRSSMINKLRTLQNAILLEKKAGKDISAMESEIEEIKKSMEAGDFHAASEV